MITSIRGQNLLTLEGMSERALLEVLDTAESFVEVNRRTIKKVQALKGRVVASIFFEESTRTRLSFETAAKRLSADVLSLAVASSSVKKGESLRDTTATIDALGIDAVVMRHQSSGAALQVSRYVPHVRVINAGDGLHQHPTQGLLDAFTIRQVLSERKGSSGVESGLEMFKGLRVLIVGDIRHSRVARSNMLLLPKLGARVILCGPRELLPEITSQVGPGIAVERDFVVPYEGVSRRDLTHSAWRGRALAGSSGRGVVKLLANLGNDLHRRHLRVGQLCRRRIGRHAETIHRGEDRNAQEIDRRLRLAERQTEKTQVDTLSADGVGLFIVAYGIDVNLVMKHVIERRVALDSFAAALVDSDGNIVRNELRILLIRPVRTRLVKDL